MIPKEYFNDKVSLGVAKGTLCHLEKNRFVLVGLGVGYGKTIMSILVAMNLRDTLDKEVQIAIFSTKAKRLDESFSVLVDSVDEYFDIFLRTVRVNGQQVGTFTGFTRSVRKTEQLEMLLEEFAKKPTLIILDETHMTLRDATSRTSTEFKKFFNRLKKMNAYVKIAGFTATPIDNPLDIVGYLVMNGDYKSRTDFFRNEIINYSLARKKGLTHRDMENLLLNEDQTLNKAFFIDYDRVIEKFSKIIYLPDAPRDFHIPKNKIIEQKYKISEDGWMDLEHFRKMEKQKAFPDKTTQRNKVIEIATTDSNALHAVLEICADEHTKVPLIFYQFNNQRDALRNLFSDLDIGYSEINAEKQTYFKESKTNQAVLVQYKSGAVAFESKESNTSIYLGLPESAIIFDQSFGRNTRRDQQVDYVNNYILLPEDSTGKILPEYERDYAKLKNKIKINKDFLSQFKTDWGIFGEDDVTLRE